MVQPAESLLRKDPARSYGTNPAVRCSLLKSEMRGVLMMVTNILGKQSPQMAFRSNRCRMLRDVGVQNASTIVADDEEAVMRTCA
jgi:hypothetical protein